MPAMLCWSCFCHRYLFVRLRRMEGAALTEPVNQSQIKIDPTVVWWLPCSGLHASDLREMISDRFTALKSASSKRHEINTRVFPITGSIKLCGLYRTYEDCNCSVYLFFFCVFVCSAQQKKNLDLLQRKTLHKSAVSHLICTKLFSVSSVIK